MRVSSVEFTLEFARGEAFERNFEVAVDFIRMILVLDEGAVRIDPVDTDIPKLPGEHFQAVHQMQAPGNIPV